MKRLQTVAAFCVSAITLSGCATFNPADGRILSINEKVAAYANEAVLLNWVRASEHEPLSFVSLSGLDDTNTIQGQIGFGGFAVGPHLHSAPRSFLLGPDQLTRSGSTLAKALVVDDPASYVALLSPVSPAVVAFFQDQGYPRELLFFLLVGSITIDGQGKRHTYVNDPSDPTFGDFGSALASLLRDGLTAQIELGAVPAGRSVPKSRLCFEPTLPVPPLCSKLGGSSPPYLR